MKKKKVGKEIENLALSLFGNKSQKVKVELDPTMPKKEQILSDKDADDSNCACE